MPLDREEKSKLRDMVSLANKSNVDDAIAAVEAARANLSEDDKDYARLTGWLEDLSHVAGGKVIGRTGDPGAQPDGMG
ncbi:MAG: hypothetical protein FJW92_02655 [Actinobacteria bacterium]|nr:hypothetical protein [Actinomycetota bacterium]